MLLNMARCDYLTLTTYHNGEGLLSSISELYPKQYGKDVKIKGYKGTQWDGLFYGVGKQRNKAHFMLRASGEGAETILFRTRDLSVKCTRIDLQITVWLPQNYQSRKLYDILESPDVEWPGRRLTPHIIQSGDGLDTIYVGSRTSERFTRIYTKPDMSGEAAYLRFEVEFKGNLAHEARRAITEQYGTTKSILRFELERLPYMASRALRAFSSVLGDSTHKIKPEFVLGQNKTLDWLEKQVEPAVMRMMNSHEHGDRMRNILVRWLGSSMFDE